MKKKIICGVISVVLFLGIILLNVNSYAALTKPDAMLDAAEKTWTAGDGGIVSSTQKVMATAITVIRIVGTGIAIIMITYVAIKYMSAAPQEKAEFKKSAVALIVGAVVLFAGTNILSIISNFATTNIGVSK